MEPEKFLTLTEFNALRKAAKDDRERCILLLLAGAGLRVGEMTQIIAEDVDFRKGYLHVLALNTKCSSQWQGKAHRAPFTQLRLYPDTAAVDLDDPLY
jgi:integrase